MLVTKNILHRSKQP